MRVVGYHISNGIIANSDGETRTEPPFLDFLLQPKESAIKVFYHLGFNVANLIKMIDLTQEQAKWLYENGKLRIPPYEISYKSIKSRYLSIKKGYYFGNPFASFGDTSQYSPAELSEAETVESCVAKAKQAQATGEIVYNTLKKLGCNPTTLTSPIRAFEKDLLSKLKLATVDDIPEDAGYYAYEAAQGNWLEAFQIGYWEKAWDYDINSAYPAEIAQLLDLRQGKWVESKNFVPEATYGYCLGTVTINAPFSPITFHKPGAGFSSLNYTPVGIWETYLTKRQIEFIRQWNLGSFEIQNGWWWTTDGAEKPLEDTIKRLHTQKEQATGLKRDIIKRVMSGIFGKFFQKIGGQFGEMFNPVYGAEVEINTQLKTAEFVLRNHTTKHLIHIAVDGMLLDRPVISHIAAERETKMGYWDQTAKSPMSCIVSGTGAVAIEGRELTGEFSLDYNWLKEQIKQNPEANEYKIVGQSPVTLAVSQQIENGWELLGRLHEKARAVGIGNEIKRCYREQPKNGGELLCRTYESLPWDISLLQKM